jgi:DNA-binding CsgD family transcriptional regulator
MARPTKPITLSVKQHECLQTTAHSRQIPHSLVQRAQIVLQAADGQPNKKIAQNLGLNENSVGLWRQRWLDNHAELAKLEDKPKQLATFISHLLTDKARPGSPGVFTAEQVCQLIALACETPPDYISHWTRSDLVREAVKRGIVESISASSVGRFLKSGAASTPSQSVLA